MVHNMRFVTYEPGNGTRYRVLFVFLNGMDLGGTPAHGDYVLIYMRDYGTAYPFIRAKFSPGYIREKLGVSEVDSTVLAELFDYILVD